MKALQRTRMMIFVIGLICSASSFAKDTAELKVGPDPERDLEIRLTGSENGPAAEITRDLQIASEHGTAYTFSENQVTYYVMRNLRAVVRNNPRSYSVFIVPSISGTYWEDHYQKGINSGRIINLSNSDLKEILLGDVEGDANNESEMDFLKTGKFIQCKWNSCEISLNKPIETEVDAENCEFHIDRIATLKVPNLEKSWESVLLVAQVRPDLQKQVRSIFFGWQKMTKVASLPGSYQIEINTTGLQDGPGPLVTRAYFRLKLLDGRVFVLHPKNKSHFQIDPFFAQHTKNKVTTHFDESMIKTMQTTAEQFNSNGSEKYINPFQCRSQ